MYEYNTASPTPSETTWLRLIREEDAPLYDGHPPSTRTRQPHRFGMVPDPVYALKDAYALAVYAVLARHFNDQDECWPSIETITDSLNISRPTAIKALKKLEHAGVISIQRRGPRSSKYVRMMSTSFTSSTQRSQPDLPKEVNDVYTELELRELEKKELTSVSSKKTASKFAPPNFQPTPEMISWAVSQGFSRQKIERETEKFRNHEFKTPRSDWPKTWRNWFCSDYCIPDARVQSTAAVQFGMTIKGQH